MGTSRSLVSCNPHPTYTQCFSFDLYAALLMTSFSLYELYATPCPAAGESPASSVGAQLGWVAGWLLAAAASAVVVGVFSAVAYCSFAVVDAEGDGRNYSVLLGRIYIVHHCDMLLFYSFHDSPSCASLVLPYLQLPSHICHTC